MRCYAYQDRVAPVSCVVFPQGELEIGAVPVLGTPVGDHFLGRGIAVGPTIGRDRLIHDEAP